MVDGGCAVSDRRPRVLTYSHDGYGLGHLRRNLRLLDALLWELPDAAALMVAGSQASHRFEFPDHVDYLKLPSLAKVANDHYVSRRLGLNRHEVASLRSALVAAAVEQFEPDLVLIDFYPLGVYRELEAALGRVRAKCPSTPVVLGWRDILDDPAQVRREWGDTGQIEAADRLFDRVLVYGSRDVYDPIVEYALPSGLASRTTFTGYLIDERDAAPSKARDVRPMVVCTVGGGEDGAPLSWAFLEAMADLTGHGWRGVLVTGPLMPAGHQRGLGEQAARVDVTCVPFVDDMAGLLGRADVVVAMAGYNSICEVLAAGAPTVVVPRVAPRHEQLLRASRMAERGLVRLVHPDALSAASLAAAVRGQAEIGRDEIRARLVSRLDTGGLRKAASVLAAEVNGRPAAVPA